MGIAFVVTTHMNLFVTDAWIAAWIVLFICPVIAVICLYVEKWHRNKIAYISQKIEFLIRNKDIPILEPVSLQFTEFISCFCFVYKTLHRILKILSKNKPN